MYPYASSYGAYGYGGYGMYPPMMMNGGYGVGAAPVQTGPYTSTPLTPYEHTNGELNHVEHTKSGMMTGGLVGAGLGAVIGGCVGGPVGIAVGAIAGGLLGGLLGDKFSGWESTNGDAEDDGKINGSSGHGGQGSFLGIF
jgi:hypothetical protein